MGNANQLMGGLLPLILIFAVFYFLLIRPQQKQKKRHQEMISSLSKGDKVVTIGGIWGEVKEIKGDSFILEIADGVKIRVLKSAIASRRQEASAES
ncbi:MAG: preprotein translocase subunit YajC [Synergistetes bacterium]|nr:preprotein translocase subunit YajC [Synergistota bacterium]